MRCWRNVSGQGLQVFAAFENLLDAEYLVGRTPLPTIGARALGPRRCSLVAPVNAAAHDRPDPAGVGSSTVVAGAC